MVLRQHHSGFTVANLERTVKFYTEGLGLEVQSLIHGPKEYHAQMTAYPGCTLEIAFLAIPNSPPVEFIEYVAPRGTALEMETKNAGNGHIALVVDDVAAVAARLIKLGGAPRSDAPITIPTGPNKGAMAMYIRDLDGITVELYQVP